MLHLPTELINEVAEWRRYLHRFPECGFNVTQTADFVAEKLASWGLEVVRPIGQSGVVGILRKGQGKASIGLRADMDALHIEEQNRFEHRSRHPGAMHACGHDGHTSMLLGAACYLSQGASFNGTVYFIFQPAEEHGKGAQAMIDDGLFERFDIDAVYGLHNLPGYPAGHFAVRPGPLMASESSFEIRISAQGGHAAMPHTGTDPVVVAAQIILGLQTIVSRSLNAIEETAVISVTELETDGTINVIPSEVVIKGDCRCFTEATLARIRQRMEQITEGLCLAAGVQGQATVINTFYPTINAKDATEHAVAAAREALGVEQVDPDCAPLMISEDFAAMLRVKPGCYALLGNGTDSSGGCALHNPYYDFNDDIVHSGMAYWVSLVMQRLS